MNPPPFPTKRISAAGVIRNAADELLMVKPSYREGWLLPGGVVEQDESPASCVLREIKEEVGLDCSIQRLICVDYVERNATYGESIHFLFECACLDAGGSLAPQIDGVEILEAVFMPLERALSHLVPSVATRLQTCRHAIGSAICLERGLIPPW